VFGFVRWRDFDGAVEAKITAFLNARDRRLDMPQGYNPLPVIVDACFEWLAVPFNGARIFVQVRYPRGVELFARQKNWTQILMDGTKRDFTELSADEICEYMNALEETVKIVLNAPTYAELEKEIFGKDRYLDEQRARLADFERRLAEVDDATARFELLRRIQLLKMRLGYALPLDTMTTLSAIANGANVTDIRKITEDILLEAYQKHRLFGGSPADYIPSGAYTVEQKSDIERCALSVGVAWERKNGGPKRNNRKY
jgi:hypothetical protein